MEKLDTHGTAGLRSAASAGITGSSVQVTVL